MKVAILIMAHDQPNHFAKLVQFFNCDWIHIFVHIDQKVDLTQFRDSIPQQDNLFFLDDSHRIKVNWGGFSQVEAMLNLLSISLKSGKNFDRFCFLSGSDFPIKPLNRLRDYWYSDQEFIRIDRKLDPIDKNLKVNNDNVLHHLNYIKYIHYLDSPLSKFNQFLPKIKRKIFNKIPLYHGSQWCSLTNNCVQYIMKFINNNPDYIQFHKKSLCSDEIFFHSIIKSSPFAENIIHDFEKEKNLETFLNLNEHGCHYIDWNSHTGKSPKVMQDSDLSALMSSKALFARKFREDTSNHLRTMITQLIL